MGNKELFEKYALLKAEIKEREIQVENLKGDLLDIAIKEGIPKTDFGYFKIKTFKSYEFSPDINLLEKELKAKKEHEVETGVAKLSEKPFLLCKL